MSYTVQDFIQLIAKLRNPDGGCPWDLAQNYQTMITCLTEECYEVIDAIESTNDQSLQKELGDLLLQVVFLSQLAAEDKKFTFDDVVDAVCKKIIYRHPHVFGDKAATSAEDALRNWNQMKEQEREEKGLHSVLDNIPHAFPSLIRAEKLQKRCSKVGFDWKEVEPVFAKVEEELAEVRAEVAQSSPNQQKIEEEVGDLLFAIVNLSRHLHCGAEESLRKANLKFEHRFRLVEKKLKEMGKSFSDTSLIEMDLLWDEVKKKENT